MLSGAPAGRLCPSVPVGTGGWERRPWHVSPVPPSPASRGLGLSPRQGDLSISPRPWLARPGASSMQPPHVSRPQQSLSTRARLPLSWGWGWVSEPPPRQLLAWTPWGWPGLQWGKALDGRRAARRRKTPWGRHRARRGRQRAPSQASPRAQGEGRSISRGPELGAWSGGRSVGSRCRKGAAVGWSGSPEGRCVSSAGGCWEDGVPWGGGASPTGEWEASRALASL